MKLHLVYFLVLSCTVLAAAWLLRPSDPIGPLRYNQIQLGMAQEQIERIIGLLPGDYCTLNEAGTFFLEMKGVEGGLPEDYARYVYKSASETWTGGLSRNGARQWVGDRYAISVTFDEEGKTMACHLLEIIPSEREPSLFQQIRSWSGW
jgi:hypothetical protein